MLRVIGAIVLSILLTACGVLGEGPDKQLVKQAIAIELSQTQQELGQQLRLDAQPTEIDISRVAVKKQTPLVIDELQAYRVRGTYDFTIKLPKRQIRRQKNPFEVYLQRQKEGKTWRLARLEADENGEPVWVTRRLQEDL